MSASRPRILVTRSPQQASALADRLRNLGAEPVLIPAIETADPYSFATLDTALAQLSSFDWLLFTSANAVEAFSRRSAHLNLTQQPSPKIAAIGQATARALEAIGITPDLLPPQAVAESLAEALLPHTHRPDGSPAHFLLIRAEEAREHLPDTLRAAGAQVTIALAYRTVVPAGSIYRIHELFSEPREGARLAAVTFTSSSTARNLFTLLEAAGVILPPDVARASIGPITSATLRELGFPPHAEAPEATVESLAETLVKYLNADTPSVRTPRFIS